MGARIVLIASWKDELPLGELRTLLAGLGPFVDGATEEDPAFTSTPREKVVERWFKANEGCNSDQAAWLAIDDHPEWYGRFVERVVATDPAMGLTEADDLNLIRLWQLQKPTQQ